MELNDSLFDKVKKKTNVSKEDISRVASKLTSDNMKDKDTLNSIIDDLSKLTGKNVSDEKREKIINIIVNDKVPSNIDKLF